MALYDSGSTYDSGILYDVVPPAPNLKKNMAKVRLNLSRLSVEQKITQGTNIKTAMTGNANFTTPNPTLIAYGTVITTLTTKNAAVLTLESQLAAAITDRDAAELAYDAATTQLASYAENVTAGDPVKLQSGGFELRSAAEPVGVPDQVLSLAVSAGDESGQLDLQWDRVKGARSYEIEVSPDPITATSWTHRPSVTRSRVTLTGFTSGQKIWVRVRAVGAAGQGAWSDPATKIVP